MTFDDSRSSNLVDLCLGLGHSRILVTNPGHKHKLVHRKQMKNHNVSCIKNIKMSFGYGDIGVLDILSLFVKTPIVFSAYSGAKNGH